MKIKFGFGFALGLAILAGILFAIYPRSTAPTAEPTLQADIKLSSPAPRSPAAPLEPVPHKETAPTPVTVVESPPPSPSLVISSTNKLERLNQIREMFHTLAAGDPATAFRAAKQIKDDTERETALLALVTEWTHGDLAPAGRRAQRIAELGLEAGLGLELVGQPELALLWANELTEGPSRRAMFQRTALGLLSSDPNAAFSLAEQLPETDRSEFFTSVFASWGSLDTEAALHYVDQLGDPDAKDAALRAIRSTAPIGIGAALRVQDGYPVIGDLIPGAPAALSGQLHPGDRIVGLAQGDSSFTDTHSVPLDKVVEMVRGAPNTILQLQVLPADAPPNSTPVTVAILRDQIKFKR